MKLSTKSEYALLSLVELAKYYQDDRYVKLDEINSKLNLPSKYLEGIFYLLKTKNLITTRRGSGGGYMLAKDPSNISIAEIVRCLDGALAPISSVSEYFYKESPLLMNKELTSFFKSLRDRISKEMESKTLQDFI